MPLQQNSYVAISLWQFKMRFLHHYSEANESVLLVLLTRLFEQAEVIVEPIHTSRLLLYFKLLILTTEIGIYVYLIICGKRRDVKLILRT